MKLKYFQKKEVFDQYFKFLINKDHDTYKLKTYSKIINSAFAKNVVGKFIFYFPKYLEFFEWKLEREITIYFGFHILTQFRDQIAQYCEYYEKGIIKIAPKIFFAEAIDHEQRIFVILRKEITKSLALVVPFTDYDFDISKTKNDYEKIFNKIQARFTYDLKLLIKSKEIYESNRKIKSRKLSYEKAIIVANKELEIYPENGLVDEAGNYKKELISIRDSLKKFKL